MKIEKPVRLSLSKQVLDQMEKCIKNGVWQVGEKIPTEPKLAKEFQVSRNTIREAIQSLVYSGILDARQGNGTYILATNKFEATITQHLKSFEISEILEARFSLEKEIVSLACKKRTDEDLKNIKLYLDKRNDTSLTSINEIVEHDINFHIAIAKASHNNFLFDLYKYMTTYIFKAINKLIEDSKFNSNLNLFHNKLYEAIKNQDSTLAKEILTNIITLDNKNILRNTED